MTYSSEVLADSPLLYWRLGDASGTTAADASGNGRTGTYNGTPTLGATSLLATDSNTAVQFDGTNDYVNRAASLMSASAQGSFEFWVKASTPGVDAVIMQATGGSAGSFTDVRASATVAGNIEVVVNPSGSGSVVLSFAGALDNAPHHIVITYNDSTDNVRAYLDGSLADSDIHSVASSVLNISSVGVGATASGSTFFAGVLDEVAIYSSELSSTRVSAHYLAGAGTPANEAILDADIPAILGSGTLTTSRIIQIDADLPAIQGNVLLTPSRTAQFNVVIPPLDGSIILDNVATAALRSEGAIPSLTAEVTLQGVIDSERNRAGAWVRDNIGEAYWAPDVEPPTAAIFPQNRVVAQAFTAPVVDGTHVLVEPTYAYAEAHRDRIVVAGRDITYFRGIPTPTPDWQYIQPLGWAAGTLRLPQVAMPFEMPGSGALSWLRKGAQVLVQRVNPDTGAIIRTDYRGIVATFDISGPELIVELGGEATGRAAMLDRQARLIQRRKPAGRMCAWAIRYMGLRHEPALGSDTGIELIDWGGGGLLDYINELVAKMATTTGDQFTIMPDDDGVYRTYLKDLTTIHGTIYLDDARVKPDLRSDMSEEPNRIFASGVTPDGMVVKFGAYPGLIQGEPAPYPFADQRTFGPGTVDADTDSGEGITVMGSQLFTMRYIGERAGDPGYNNYDAEYVAGIKALQKDAGLSVTGNMNVNTWLALWNLSVTGYSLRNIQILPAAEDPRVQGWRRSANGSIIDLNPTYDPSVIPVERTIAMGAGFTRDQIRGWAEGELSDGDSWRGTITITTGAIVAGNHTPGAPITSILRARDIRAGMNFRLPLLGDIEAGGITVHCAAVSVRDQGQTVELVVSTRPGDTLPVWAAIQRDRDNRNTVHRSFFAQRRAANLERENTFDEVGGVISPVKLNPGGWTVFPVVAKQAGTIQKLRLRLTDDREFVCAVFGRRISPARLRKVTNAPLTNAGTKRWTNETVLDRLDEKYVLLYVAGSDEDPCGYSPGRKSDDGNLTGRWIDDASFPFVTFTNDSERGSVLWVAVWVTDGDPVKVRGGRIMWPSAEDY